MWLFPRLISRRLIARAAPALLVVSLLTVACQPAATPAPTSAPAAPAAKPAESKPAETKPAEAKPAAQAQPTQAQPAAPAAAPAATKPAETKPAADAKPTSVPAAAARPADAKPAATDKADVEAAKKEGAVVWYTSTPLRQAQVVADAFEKKYGFKVEVFRTGGEQVIQRFQTELSAGKTLVDLLTASDPAAFDEMVKKNQLVKFRPEHFDKTPPAARNEDGFWVAQRLNLTVMAFRDDKENAAEMPKKWADVADPKYKGKLVHADPAFTAIAQQIVGTFARDKGWDFYEALKKNDMMIVQGHQQLAEILALGERTVAAEAGDADMWDLRRRGVKVTTIYPEEGTFVIPAPTGIVAASPHPNAAKLLAEYMLSDEAQKLFPAEGFYAARTDMPAPEGAPPLDKLKLITIDQEYTSKHVQDTKQRFGEIFSN
jgi:iron(III) transport system substrate-binding protein